MMMGGMIGFCKFESIRETELVKIQKFAQKGGCLRIDLIFIPLCVGI